MKIKIYQVDAFCHSLFSGNPAAICPLDSWLDDSLMLQIAEENNLSETAFYVANGATFDLRWFTPASEVDLCGHATLATAHVLFQHEKFSGNQLVFNTRSGQLTVAKEGDQYKMDFPADELVSIETPKVILEALGVQVEATFQGRDDYIAIFASQQIIEQLQPDFKTLLQLNSRGFIATAPGDNCDFVSRCFYPHVGVDEDPVTGSAHTSMTPYWAKRLGKNKLSAQQLSKRGGQVQCELVGNRVLLKGQAKTYMIGEIFL